MDTSIDGDGLSMDMTKAVRGLVNIFVNMDISSRGIFIRILIAKMHDEEIDLVLRGVDLRHSSKNQVDASNFLENCELNRSKLVDVKGDIKTEPQIGGDGGDNDEDFDVNIVVDTCNEETEKIEGIDIKNEDKAFYCSECNKSFNSEIHLSKHLTKHKGPVFSCEFCPKTFFDESKWNLHMRKHTDENPHPCPYCDLSFPLFIELKKHRIIHPEYEVKIKSRKNFHGELNDKQPSVCDECGKTFTSKPSLLKHIFLHTGEKPFTCDKCPKAFPTKVQLRSHSEVHLPLEQQKPKRLICDVCSKAFGHSTDLKRHRLTHTGEKPFACDQCEYRTAQKSSLEKHKRTHTGERPYSCHLCTSTYSNSSHLSRHLKSHMGEKTHFCDQCPKKFSTTDKLKLHSIVHTGERAFFCDECPKTFAQGGSLNSHKDTEHRGIVFYCDECPISFKQQRSLEKHKEAEHRGQHLCSLCPKAFITEEKLRKHILVHTGEKPSYTCDECPKSYTTRSSLMKHKDMEHYNSFNHPVGAFAAEGTSQDSSNKEESETKISGSMVFDHGNDINGKFAKYKDHGNFNMTIPIVFDPCSEDLNDKLEKQNNYIHPIGAYRL